MAPCILNPVASLSLAPDGGSCATQSVANTDAEAPAAEAAIEEMPAEVPAAEALVAEALAADTSFPVAISSMPDVAAAGETVAAEAPAAKAKPAAELAAVESPTAMETPAAKTPEGFLASGASIGEKEAQTLVRIHDPTQSRIEALIEQQNALMLRQLQLAEESRIHTDMVYQYRKPCEFLKTLDPCVRGLFADWRGEFRGMVSEYISQSRLSLKYQDQGADGRLMKPLLDETQKRWQWSSFYRGVATAIDGIDPAGDAYLSIDDPGMYDIDSAYAQLRYKHAAELQTFVFAHQEMCLEKITYHITLANQVRILEGRLEEWETGHSDFCHAETKRHLKSNAKTFVELVHSEEMTKAERQIKEDEIEPSSVFLTIVRIICMLVVLLALATMSHELLTRVFASLFALVCGMALLWEDFVVCSVRLLLGETFRRLRVLGGRPRHMRCLIPTIAW